MAYHLKYHSFLYNTNIAIFSHITLLFDKKIIIIIVFRLSVFVHVPCTCIKMNSNCTHAADVAKPDKYILMKLNPERFSDVWLFAQEQLISIMCCLTPH